MEENIQQIKTLIGKLQVNPWLPVSSLGLESLRSISSTIDGLRYEHPWDEWQSEGQVESKMAHIVQLEVLPIGRDHTARTWHAFFRGETPFRSSRAREDIPDAYIAQAVIDQARSTPYGQNVYFISADKRLKLLEENLSLVVLSTLSELFVREELAIQIKPSVSKSSASADLLKSEELASLARDVIYHRTIEIYDDRGWFPGSRDIAPVMWKKIEDFVIHSADVEAWGGGWFSLPYEAYQDILVEEDRINKEVPDHPDHASAVTSR